MAGIVETFTESAARAPYIYRRRLSFHDQYADPRWTAFAKRIIARDGHKCRLCDSRHNLQPHHIRYIRGLLIWEYPDYLMMTVCRKHHKVLTRRQRAARYIRKRWLKQVFRRFR